MKGILLYTRSDAIKNRWFIGHLMKKTADFGAELTLALHDDPLAFDPAPYPAIDFCINRTRMAVVNQVLEGCGIRCYNNLATVTVANDKWKTHALLQSLGIPTLDTVLVPRTDAPPLPFPYVLKARGGHGGSQVFWVESKADLDALSLSDPAEYIAQRPASAPRVDVRIYVVGGAPVLGVKRTAQGGFRSNFSLGGQVGLFTPTAEQLDVIAALQRELAADYAGFDFLLHEGKWVLNEIEDVVGARMVYSLCDYDIGEAFIRSILGT